MPEAEAEPFLQAGWGQGRLLAYRDGYSAIPTARTDTTCDRRIDNPVSPAFGIDRGFAQFAAERCFSSSATTSATARFHG
jgi:hypothetical protein